MKFRNIFLLCSMSFAAGMVVPFMFLELHANKNSSEPVVGGANTTPLKQQVVSKPYLPRFDTGDVRKPQQGNSQALNGLPQGETVFTEIGRADPDIFSDIVVSGNQSENQSPSAGGAHIETVELDSEQKVVADIQTELLILGYDPGIIDGKIGRRTQYAIKALQRDRVLLETGMIDEELFKALNKDRAEEPHAPETEFGFEESEPIVEAETEQIARVQTSQSLGAPVRLFDQHR